MSKHLTELESVKQLLPGCASRLMWRNLVFSSSLLISQPSDQSNHSQILAHMKKTCKEFLKICCLTGITMSWILSTRFSMVQHRQLIKQQCRLGGETAFLDIYLMSYVVLITIKLLTLINKTRQELGGCLWLLHSSVTLHYLPAKQAESNWTTLVIGWDQHWHLQEVSDITERKRTKSAVADFHDTNSIVYYYFAHSSIPHFNQFSSYSQVKNR